MMLRAAIYTRISQDPDGRQTATARQLADCIAFIASRGWEHVETYEDPDLSAYTQKNVRPSFERLKDDVKAGHIEAVVGWKLDRLFRRTRDFSDLDEICEAMGARIVTVVDAIDTGTSAGRLVATVMTGMARAESENISIRQLRKHQEIARQGGWSGGGRRMFGFRADGRGIVPEEAALIQEGARRVLAGESLSGICRDWNERGHRTSTGNHWAHNSLRQLLGSHQIAGQRFHKGVVYPAQWPAIISPAEHASIERLFAGRERHKMPVRTHYLTGLLRCALCDGPMRGRSTSKRARGYGCTGCSHVRRKADPLEEYVRDLLFERIESPAFLERLARESAPTEFVDSLLAEIRADELALEELAHDRYVARILGPAEFASAHASLTVRLEAHRKRLSDMAPTDPGIDITRLRGQWPGATTEWRARAAGWAIERIVVGPSPLGRLPFHAESVTIHWRF